MKLTFDDLINARYTPHTVKGKNDTPLGNMVLLRQDGTDIGEVLITGDFESDDPFVQLMAEVLSETTPRPTTPNVADSKES